MVNKKKGYKRGIGIPPYLLRILHYSYLHQTMQARWGKSISAPFLVTNGIWKAATCLVNLCMNYISKQLKLDWMYGGE